MKGSGSLQVDWACGAVHTKASLKPGPLFQPVCWELDFFVLGNVFGWQCVILLRQLTCCPLRFTCQMVFCPNRLCLYVQLPVYLQRREDASSSRRILVICLVVGFWECPSLKCSLCLLFGLQLLGSFFMRVLNGCLRSCFQLAITAPDQGVVASLLLCSWPTAALQKRQLGNVPPGAIRLSSC